MAPFRPLHLLLFLLYFAASAAAEPTRDRAALLDFLNGTRHGRRLQWNASSSACEWVGVTCDPNRTAVTALRLPGVGLLGPIAPSTLSLLSGLRILSLRSNRLSGPIPPDFADLTQLRFLYLHRNHFSGPIPPGLTRLTHLNRLVLADNNLTGEIPSSVSNLTSLTHLFLENNGFSGEISSINLPGLIGFNVSNNRLGGSIPESLARFPSSSFAGNLALCGGPLSPCASAPAPSPSADEGNSRESSRKLSTAAIIGISVAAVAAFILLMLILLVIVVSRRRSSRGSENRENKSSATEVPRSMEMSVATVTETGTSSSKDDRGLGEVNKLVFVERGLYSFDLEDLLRASAEVLGKGSLGTSYKAVLEDGTTVVVKRLKDVAAPKREFELHLEALGKVKHPNVVPLRAFYYSKDEKLLVSDYVGAGSLSALLHGNRATGRSLLDWHNRVRIALAAARGISHLHLSANIVHGNLKASNILLRHDQEAAAVSDYGLTPMFGSTAPPSRVAGYRAPEVVETQRPTYTSDVYSFGVVVLELLTGRAPNQAYGEEGTDLVRWVQSVASEELASEVFDPELVKYGGREEDMVQLLQIATACVSTVPDSRPGIEEVLKVVEEIATRTEGASSDDPSKNGSGVPTSPVAATP